MKQICKLEVNAELVDYVDAIATLDSYDNSIYNEERALFVLPIERLNTCRKALGEHLKYIEQEFKKWFSMSLQYCYIGSVLGVPIVAVRSKEKIGLDPDKIDLVDANEFLETLKNANSDVMMKLKEQHPELFK